MVSQTLYLSGTYLHHIQVLVCVSYVTKNGKELKNEQGNLISPRPKQKFGTDKIIGKIDEFLVHEQEDDYFEKLLEKQLIGVSEAKKKELLEKRMAYSNNKNVYSLLMQ